MITAVGIVLLAVLLREHSNILTLVPGLLIGLGAGGMAVPSINVVQSAFGEEDQGTISGLSRSVSNLGSSLGVALAGSILVATAVPSGKTYEFAMIVLVVMSLFGLGAATLIPRQRAVQHAPAASAAPHERHGPR